MKKGITVISLVLTMLMVIIKTPDFAHAATETKDYVGADESELNLHDDTVVEYQIVSDDKYEGKVIKQSVSENGKTVLVVGSMRADGVNTKYDTLGILLFIVVVIIIIATGIISIKDQDYEEKRSI